MKNLIAILPAFMFLIFFGCGGGGSSPTTTSDNEVLEIISSQEAEGKISSVVIENNRMYVAEGNSGLKIFDVSDPGNPEIIGEIAPYGTVMDSPDFFSRVTLVDQIAYVVVIPGCSGFCTPARGLLRIYDVSVPAAPALLTQIDIPVNGILAENNNLYVTGFDLDSIRDVLNIIDISDPENPTILGATTIMPGGQIFKSGNILLSPYNNLTKFESIQAIDVSDPTNPFEINGSEFGTMNVAHAKVSFYGNYAYVADKIYGLKIIDLTDPLNPLEVQNIQTDDPVLSVYAWEGYLYVVNNLSGVSVYDLTDPEYPEFYKLINTTSEPKSVYVADGIGVIATKEVRVSGNLVQKERINIFTPKSHE